MTVVVRGMGLDVDATSSVVAFGFALDPTSAVEPAVALDAATIEQSFVVEFAGARRKPTGGEWRRWRRWVDAIARGGVDITIEKRGKETIYVLRRNTDTPAGRRRARLARSAEAALHRGKPQRVAA